MHIQYVLKIPHPSHPRKRIHGHTGTRTRGHVKSLFPETDAGIKILWGKLSRSGMTRELELADSAPLAVNKRGYCGDTSLSVRILPVDSLETRWRLAASRFRSSTLINCPLRVLRSSTSPSSVNSGKCFFSLVCRADIRLDDDCQLLDSN